jgi:hypothetical protein
MADRCSFSSSSIAAAPSNLGVLQGVVEVSPGMDDPYGMQRVSVDRCVAFCHNASTYSVDHGPYAQCRLKGYSTHLRYAAAGKMFAGLLVRQRSQSWF